MLTQGCWVAACRVRSWRLPQPSVETKRRPRTAASSSASASLQTSPGLQIWTPPGRRTEQEADPSVAAKSLCASGSTTAPSSTSTVADGRRRAAERQTLARYHVEFYVNFLCVATPAHTHTLYICIMHKSPLQMF